MLRKIYRELVCIRKELHAIRSNMESLREPQTIDDVNRQLAERLMQQRMLITDRAVSAKSNALASESH